MADYRSQLALTRQQLAQFLKSPELIQAFEALSVDVVETIPANEAQTNLLAKAALALAAQAMMMASDSAQEESFIVPGRPGDQGPQGPQGVDGRLVMLYEDRPATEEHIPPSPMPPTTVTGSRSSGAALVSLLAALAIRGVIIDNTTA